MCIAILNTEKKLTKETLKNCWKANADGAGLTYPDGWGGMITIKELKSFDVFYNAYEKAREGTVANILIHFRIKTHGKVSLVNCHPFAVNDKLSFIHNGMIYSKSIPTTGDYSDTFQFNELILKGLPDGFLLNRALKDMIADFIGNSKLVFLDANNEYTIINEDAGHWNDGDWFSNHSYKKVEAYKFNYKGAEQYFSQSSLELKTPLVPESDPPRQSCDCCDSPNCDVFYSPNYGIDMCLVCLEQYDYDYANKNREYFGIRKELIDANKKTAAKKLNKKILGATSKNKNNIS